MKIYLVLFFLSAVLLASCSSNPPAQTSTPADGPAAVLKRYVAASQKGDIATMKSLLSQSSLRFIEDKGKPLKIGVDDVLRRETEVKLQGEVETRNERVEGETATVEVKNPLTGEFDLRYPFVKENGAWKLARDRYIEEEERKIIEELNRQLANSANSAGNVDPNARFNAPANSNTKSK